LKKANKNVVKPGQNLPQKRKTYPSEVVERKKKYLTVLKNA
jgi:hypothetical protein